MTEKEILTNLSKLFTRFIKTGGHLEKLNEWFFWFSKYWELEKVEPFKQLVVTGLILYSLHERLKNFPYSRFNHYDVKSLIYECMRSYDIIQSDANLFSLKEITMLFVGAVFYLSAISENEQKVDVSELYELFRYVLPIQDVAKVCSILSEKRTEQDIVNLKMLLKSELKYLTEEQIDFILSVAVAKGFLLYRDLSLLDFQKLCDSLELDLKVPLVPFYVALVEDEENRELNRLRLLLGEDAFLKFFHYFKGQTIRVPSHYKFIDFAGVDDSLLQKTYIESVNKLIDALLQDLEQEFYSLNLKRKLEVFEKLLGGSEFIRKQIKKWEVTDGISD